MSILRRHLERLEEPVSLFSLLDRGHRLSGHPGEGVNLLFDGQRLGREVPVFKGVPVAPRSSAAGAHLVRDAFTNAFEVAVVLTNDSDLVEPIRIATAEAGKRVGLLVPVKYPTPSLAKVSSFLLHIRPGHLSNAQFPANIPHPDGTVISKPAPWVEPPNP